MVDLIRYLQLEEAQLKVATGMFVRKGNRPTDDYWSTVRRVYGGTIHEVDFVDNSEMVRRNINAWLKERTDHKIKGILTPGSVTSATRMCLVNGVKFSALWPEPFFPSELRRHEFYGSYDDEEGEIDVEMVSRIDEYAYVVDRELRFTAIEVPHLGGRTSLVIVMPHQRHDFRVFEDRRQLEKLLDLPDKMIKTPDVELCLPKLKLDMGLRLDSILYYMGLSELFNEGANLSGIFGSRSKLFMTDWFHHTVVELANVESHDGRRRPSLGSGVIEGEDSPPSPSGQGTPPRHDPGSPSAVPKASCLKKNKAKPKRSRSSVRTKIPFIVNRPFIFFIVHRKLSLLLFLGVVKKVS